MEQLLHYVWEHKQFPLTGLYTTENLPVEVIDAGLKNRDAGPDFFNAKIKINGTLWVGNVEIHSFSSDWSRHGHQKNRAYDSVILHVVGEVDVEAVFRSTGEPIPQLRLVCPEAVRLHYNELKQAEVSPACYSILSTLSSLKIHAWLAALRSERFEQKTAVIRKRLERLNNHWEDAFFITLARNFGFGINGDAFEMWAYKLDLRAVDKHRDDPLQVEAIFFGQGGLLEEKVEGDSYYESLQKEYRFLKHKFGLSQSDSSLWKFLRLRPGNFPHVRIAQLASLYGQQRGLLSQVIEAHTLEQLRAVFTTGTSTYWKEHFIFGKCSPQKEKKVGTGSLNLIIINTVVPFLYAYGLYRADETLCNRATGFLEELKAENNYITRLWSSVGISVRTAADSQALIQLQKEYCDVRKCLYCRFGYEYLRQK